MILPAKKQLIRRMVFCLVIIGSLFGIIASVSDRVEKQNTVAISEDGDEVTLQFDGTEDGKIFYGQRRREEDHHEDGDRGATHWFTTITQNSGSYTAYCSQPTKKPLAGTFKVSLLDDNNSAVPAQIRKNYKMMKLLIFAMTEGGPGSADDPNMRTAAINLKNYLFDSATLSGLRIPSYEETTENLVYAYTHAVLGYIYDVDYVPTIVARELGNELGYIQGIVNKLSGIVDGTISGHANAFTMSQNYNLYTVDRYEPVHIDINDYDPSEYQDIVWIESPESGTVVVKKQDSENVTAQGNTNLSGITFKVKNDAGRRIYDPVSKAFYDNGAIMRSATTGSAGTVSFELPLGKFSVYEDSSNNFYEKTDVTPRSVQILEYRGDEIGLTFNNRVKHTSKVKVYKKDKDSASCTKSGNASLANAKFNLYNVSSQPIVYNGSTIPVNGKIAEKTVQAGSCEVVFDNLPAGTYRVEEASAGAGYKKESSTKDVTVGADSEGSVDMFNQVYRGNVKFQKVDKNNNNAPMANVAFRITSKTTGESHIVVTDGNGMVDTSAIAHDRNTNRYDAAGTSYVYHNDWGTWFYGNAGMTGTISNSLGALPYDNYTLTELACPTNEFCYNVDRFSKDFSVTSDGTVSVALPGSPFENDCVHHEIATTASDPVDGDKYILVGEEVTVRDRVAYHAMRGKSYTVRGTLYDAETGLPLNSTQSKSFSIPENGSEDGYVDLDFTFDSTEYAGHSIVVFEELVYDNRVVAEHKELTDEKQTVYVIDFGTTAVDDADGDKYIANEENMTIEDTIDYCLVAHQSFRFVAHLYDKTTGRLLVNSNGDVIEYSLDVTPETACGAAVIELGFNAKGLEGHHIVVFEKLYHEDDLIMTHEDEEDEDQTVYVIGFGTTAVDQEDRDKYVIDGDLVTIRDRIRYCLVADRTFTVSAYLVDKATGQPIEGGEGEIVSRTYTFVPNTDCGSFVATFKVNASKLAGHDLVAFERVLDDGKVVLTHEDIEDQNETVRVISLQTFATSNQDEIDELDEESEIVITDLVKYCLKANNEFTFVGKLYDKDSGQQLVIDGTPVEQSYTFTPKKDCGEFELTYKFPAKGMAKKEFVILEELYDDFGRRILLREDLDNEDETVRLPDTGYMIKADGGVDGGSNPAVIALLGVLVTAAFVIVRGFTKTIISTRRAF